MLLDILKGLEAAHGRLSSQGKAELVEEKLQEEISLPLPYTHGEQQEVSVTGRFFSFKWFLLNTRGVSALAEDLP